jgi:hypothetical protein
LEYIPTPPEGRKKISADVILKNEERGKKMRKLIK